MDPVTLGIYGGSFDPVHVGHVEAAAHVRRRRGLERVFLVPAASPPHKEGGCAASVEHRLAMARLAVEGRGGLGVLDLEAHRPPPSYTIDTVEGLRRERPGADFELLVGADMLGDLPTWRRAGEIVAAVRVVAFGRPSADAGRARAAFERAFGPGRYDWEEIPLVEAASSEIRRRLAAGEPVEGLLDPRVLAYIVKNRLYGQGG